MIKVSIFANVTETKQMLMQKKIYTAQFDFRSILYRQGKVCKPKILDYSINQQNQVGVVIREKKHDKLKKVKITMVDEWGEWVDNEKYSQALFQVNKNGTRALINENMEQTASKEKS